jgi:hypothetical protein
MFGSARDHFLQNVWPSYRTFFEQRDAGKLGVNDLVRHGTQAAGALYHMREHLPVTVGRAEIELGCADYALIGDVANAAKHKTLTRSTPRVSDASGIFEAGVITRFQDEQGEYSCPQAEVFVRLDNGTERRLADLLFGVMVMWCDRLRALNVIDAKEPGPLDLDRHVSREEAARREMPLQINAGEEWRLQLRLFRFDYAKHRSEPIDLTGAEMRFTLYAPPKHVSIDVVMKEGDSPTSFEVPLSEAQSHEYVKLKEPAEQHAYVARLLASNPDLQVELMKKYAAEHSAMSGGSGPNQG